MLPAEFIFDSPKELVSADAIRTLQLVLDLTISLIFILTGLVTNCFSIRVFLKQGFVKIPVNVTLFALAIADFACLLFALLYRTSYIAYAAFSYSEYHFWYYNVLFPIAGLQLIVSRIAFSMTALLSLERWIAVTYPLRAKRWLTLKRLVGSTIATVVLIITLTFPAGILVRFTDDIDPRTNKTESILVMVITSKGVYIDQAIEYMLYCGFIIIPSVCILTVIVCTVSIIVKLKQAQTWRRSIDSFCSRPEMPLREARTAKTLITIMIIFIVCEVPMNVWAYVQIWERLEQHNLHVSLLLLAIFLETMNSSVNFFVYFTFYPSFKETFLSVYPCFRYCENSNCILCCRNLSGRYSKLCCAITKDKNCTLRHIPSSQRNMVEGTGSSNSDVHGNSSLGISRM